MVVQLGPIYWLVVVVLAVCTLHFVRLSYWLDFVSDTVCGTPPPYDPLVGIYNKTRGGKDRTGAYDSIPNNGGIYLPAFLVQHLRLNRAPPLLVSKIGLDLTTTLLLRRFLQRHLQLGHLLSIVFSVLSHPLCP